MKSFVPNDAIHAESFGSAPNMLEDPISICDNKAVKISAIRLKPSSTENSFVKPDLESFIYICELPEIKGKFYKEKATAFGLDPGPKFKKLQERESVQSDHRDIMVHPSDVIGHSTPGPLVFLVDCPTENHVEKLYMLQSLNAYYTSEQVPPNKTVSWIIHLTPSCIVRTAKYQRWMQKFGAKTQHIMAGYAIKNISAPIMKSSAIITSRLNYLCPRFFPSPASLALRHSDSHDASSACASETCMQELLHIIDAENLLKFILRPYDDLGLDKSDVTSSLTLSQVIDDLLLEVPEITEAAQQVGRFFSEPELTGVTMNVNQDEKGNTENPSSTFGSHPSCLDSLQRDEVEIVLLGTGSSQPSKYRNVSSIYINLFSKGSLLLDCGEGTLGQLTRRYGREDVLSAVRNLKCIWISHIHADHHAGLSRILALRRDLLKGVSHEPIVVIGPQQLATFLDKYNDLEDLNMQFLDCKSTTSSAWDDFDYYTELQSCKSFSYEDYINNNPPIILDKSETEGIKMYASLPREEREAIYAQAQPAKTDLMDCEYRQVIPDLRGSCSKRQKLSIAPNVVEDFLLLKRLKEVLEEAGLQRLTSFRVVHCRDAFGVIMKARERLNDSGAMKPGWKIVYSGDTRPCTEVIEASHGATLLIHEATFEDSLGQDALAKKHNTTEEAIEVGESSGAYRVILTHFSQRYPKIPSFGDINSHKTCIAFDLMSINMADLPLLPRILPYLKLLFKNDAS